MIHILSLLLIFQVNLEISKKEARTKIAQLRARGQYERVIQIADLILKKNPDDFEFFKYKIDAFNRLGKRDTVRLLIDRYLSRKRSPRVYRDLYSLLYFSGGKDFALEILKKGRETLGSDTLFAREFYYLNLWDRNFPDALYELFNFYLQTGSITLLRQEFGRIEKFFDEQTIRRILTKWLRKHPDHREVRIILADYYLRKGKPEEMLKELRLSGYTKNMKDFARYLISIGDYLRADSLLDLENKKDGSWFFLKAQVLSKLKRYREAADFYKKAYFKFKIKGAGDSLVTLLFFRLRDFDSVLKYAGRNDELRIRAILALGKDSLLFKMDRSNETVLYYLGLLYFVRDMPESAGIYWNRLASRFPASRYLYNVFFLKEIQDNFGNSDIFKKFLDVENLLLRWEIDSALEVVRSAIHDTTGVMKFELAKIQELREEYELALATYTRVGDGSKSFLSPYAYFRAFRIAQDRLKNAEIASEIGKKLIERYPTTPYAAAVRALL